MQGTAQDRPVGARSGRLFSAGGGEPRGLLGEGLGRAASPHGRRVGRAPLASPQEARRPSAKPRAARAPCPRSWTSCWSCACRAAPPKRAAAAGCTASAASRKQTPAGPRAQPIPPGDFVKGSGALLCSEIRWLRRWVAEGRDLASSQVPGRGLYDKVALRFTQTHLICNAREPIAATPELTVISDRMRKQLMAWFKRTPIWVTLPAVSHARGG